jgi:hypothetical protein
LTTSTLVAVSRSVVGGVLVGRTELTSSIVIRETTRRAEVASSTSGVHFRSGVASKTGASSIKLRVSVVGAHLAGSIERERASRASNAVGTKRVGLVTALALLANSSSREVGEGAGRAKLAATSITRVETRLAEITSRVGAVDLSSSVASLALARARVGGVGVVGALLARSDVGEETKRTDAASSTVGEVLVTTLADLALDLTEAGGVLTSRAGLARSVVRGEVSWCTEVAGGEISAGLSSGSASKTLAGTITVGVCVVGAELAGLSETRVLTGRADRATGVVGSGLETALAGDTLSGTKVGGEGSVGAELAVISISREGTRGAEVASSAESVDLRTSVASQTLASSRSRRVRAGRTHLARTINREVAGSADRASSASGVGLVTASARNTDGGTSVG